MSSGGPPDEVHQDKKTKLAVEFAGKFVRDHRTIDDEDFLELKKHFSEKEISAMVGFMAFMAAAHKFGTVMDLPKQTDQS